MKAKLTHRLLTSFRPCESCGAIVAKTKDADGGAIGTDGSCSSCGSALPLAKNARRLVITDLGFPWRGVRLQATVGQRGTQFRARCDSSKLMDIVGRRVVTVTLGAFEGQPGLSGLGLSLDDAREAASDVSRLVNRGLDPRGYAAAENEKRITAAAASVLTLEAAAVAWREKWAKVPKKGRTAPRVRTWKERFRLVEQNSGFLWGMSVDEIQPAHIRAALVPVAERAPAVANRTLGAISAVFEWLRSKGLTDVNPARSVSPPGDESDRRPHRAMTWQEVCSVWQAAESVDTIGAAAMLWCLLTMQRPEAVYSARRSEIWQQSWWLVPGERTVDGEYVGGQKRATDFAVWVGSPLAQRVLARAIALGGESEWLFPSPTGRDAPIRAPRQLVRDLREATGIGDLTPRMMRSTAATLTVVSGATPKEVSYVLDHKQPDVPRDTSTYVQASARKQVEETLRLWHQALEEQLGFEGNDRLNVLPFPS